MVRLSTLLYQTLAVVSVLGQTAPNADAQYVLNQTAVYLSSARDLALEAQNIDTLSCLLYAADRGAYAKIVPILNQIKDFFREFGPTIEGRPPLDKTISSDVTVAKSILNNIARATIQVSNAVDEMIEGGGSLNLCSVAPGLGKGISTALRGVRISIPIFYIPVFTFAAPELAEIQRYYFSVLKDLDSGIEAFEGLIKV
ncbi:hypothetical protein QBC41DRAFT_394009 [Cercophora samala]|uniref:Uncharacterized protein n=1 Tax=Cercophora samala TaxID=330535 RepID=A0AA40DBX7_9PEZI|nr:hypothetical protein QBC41DRAFT_394009 [Cercophora samala]